MRFKFFSCQSHCPLGKTYVLVILQTSDTVSQKSQQVLYTVDLVRPKKIIPKTNLNGSKNCFNFKNHRGLTIKKLSICTIVQQKLEVKIKIIFEFYSRSQNGYFSNNETILKTSLDCQWAVGPRDQLRVDILYVRLGDCRPYVVGADRKARVGGRGV